MRKEVCADSFNVLLWGLIGLTAFTSIINSLQIHEGLARNGPIIMVSLMVLYSWGHGYKRYGLKNLLIFIVIVFVVGNFFENLSVATTFPFGAYHYTGKLGPKLIFTPLIVNIAYFQMIYLAWNLGGAIIGYYQNVPQGKYVIAQPVMAMFITVMWDLGMDPIMSTLLGHWEWHQGGAYFGVPIQNFYGWYLCTFTMFILFAGYMNMQKDKSTPAFVFTKSNWMQVICAYLVVAGSILFLSVCVVDIPQAAALGGRVWQNRDVLLSCGIVTLSTMFFVAVLALIRILLLDDLAGQKNKTT